MPWWRETQYFIRMLNHTVFFWLKDTVSAEERAAFEKDLRGLEGVPDVEAQNVYQQHPLHQDFVAKWKPHFEKIVVYDFE